MSFIFPVPDRTIFTVTASPVFTFLELMDDVSEKLPTAPPNDAGLLSGKGSTSMLTFGVTTGLRTETYAELPLKKASKGSMFRLGCSITPV